MGVVDERTAGKIRDLRNRDNDTTNYPTGGGGSPFLQSVNAAPSTIEELVGTIGQGNPQFINNANALASDLNLGAQRSLDMINENQRAQRGYLDQVGQIGLGGQDATTQTQLGNISDQLGNINVDTTGAQNKLGTLGGNIAGLSTQAGNIDVSNIGTQRGQIENIAGQLQGIAGGGADPRFAAVRDAQLQQLGSSQARQQALQSEQFSRRGLGGSAAAMNAQNQLAGQFGQQEQALQAQIGMQQMGREDQALLQSAALRGQAGSMTGQEAQLRSGLLSQQAGMQGQQAGLIGQQAGLQGQQAQLQSALYGQQAGLSNQQLQNAMATGQFQQGLIGQQAGMQNAAQGLQSGLLGQMTGLQAARTGQSQDALSTFLQNATVPYTLETARQAATGDAAADAKEWENKYRTLLTQGGGDGTTGGRDNSIDISG